MSRTPGSGWGGGAMLYQKCPKCSKKRALFITHLEKYKCTACKEYFIDETGELVRAEFLKQIKELEK